MAAAAGDIQSSTGPDDGTLRFRFASRLEHGHAVQQKILDEVARHDFGDDASFAIRLALEEALVNAIRHGNKLDESKSVEVWAKVTPEALEVTIQDEGPGFDRHDIPDPTKPENLEKCSGRGVLLIEAYMTEATWTDSGRRLRMVKHNAPEPPKVPA